MQDQVYNYIKKVLTILNFEYKLNQVLHFIFLKYLHLNNQNRGLALWQILAIPLLILHLSSPLQSLNID